MSQNHPDRTEAEQVAFFEQTHERFVRAEGAVGRTRKAYAIAGTIVRLGFAGEALIGLLTPALSHLEVEPETPADVTFCIWDSASTGVQNVRIPCPQTAFTDRGDVWGFSSRRIHTAFHWHDFSLNVLDLQTARGVFWVNTPDTLPGWTFAAPLRTLLFWWLQHNGVQLVHAAAVGIDGQGVLLTGKGGSGKSTSALSCVGADHQYLGDDYIAVGLTPEPTVYSLYNSAKVHHDQLAHLSEVGVKVVDAPALLASEDSGGGRSIFRRSEVSPGDVADEKSIMLLHPERASQIVTSLPLAGVLQPVISGNADSRVAPTSPDAIERAMAFTTMSQLPGAGPATREFIGAIARSVPIGTLQVGTDRRLIPDTIASFARHPPATSLDGATDMPLPQISVVIPVYNGADFIADAVDNVLSQGYPGLEIIIVDDGSTDGTEAVVRALDNDVRYFQRANRGPAAARNFGIMHATAEFIAFLDVDDLWPQGTLHTLVRFFEDASLQVVRGHAQVLQHSSTTGRYELVGGPHESYPDYIGAGLYRKAAFQQVGLFDPRMTFAEDLDWFNRATEDGLPMRRIDDITLSVRRHSANMTRDKSFVELSMLRAFKNSLDRSRGRAPRA